MNLLAVEKKILSNLVRRSLHGLKFWLKHSRNRSMTYEGDSLSQKTGNLRVRVGVFF